MAMRWKFYWLLVVTTIAIYLAMLFWALPKINLREAVPFDLRPTGYTFDEARNYLSSLDNDGRNFYLGIQQWLDTFFPAMLAVVLTGAFLTLKNSAWGWLLSAFAFFGALFDYLENHAVGVMLRAWPDGVTREMADTASNWTVMKSVSDTVALTGLLVLLIIKGFRWWKTRRFA